MGTRSQPVARRSVSLQMKTYNMQKHSSDFCGLSIVLAIKGCHCQTKHVEPKVAVDVAANGIGLLLDMLVVG